MHGPHHIVILSIRAGRSRRKEWSDRCYPLRNAPPTISHRLCRIDWMKQKAMVDASLTIYSFNQGFVQENKMAKRRFKNPDTMDGASWHRSIDGYCGVWAAERTSGGEPMLGTWVGTCVRSAANHQRGPGDYARNRSARVKAHAHDQNILELPWRAFKDWRQWYIGDNHQLPPFNGG